MSKSRHPSLILNEDMKIEFTWELWSAEVDQLAKLITGKKKLITEDDVTGLLSGILDALVVHNLDVDDKRQLAEKALRDEGRSEAMITSYLIGWDKLDETVNLPKTEAEANG